MDITNMIAIMILIATLVNSVISGDCPSKHFCHTTEIKYRAFDELPGMYLNSTNHVFKTFMANTSQKCMQECTRTENCKSANHYLPTNQQEMICDLIDGNKWSNASLLVRREHSTHFYVQNACASNPCKNGATCISFDQEASYKCACPDSNNTVTYHGFHCETVKVAEENADAYYNFNQVRPIDVIYPKSYTFYKYGSATTLRVPDRRHPVLYLPGISDRSQYSKFSGLSSTCLRDIDACIEGLSVSFWFRIFKRAQQKFTDSSCSSIKAPMVSTIITPTGNYRGFQVEFTGCKTDAFVVYAKGDPYLWTAKWGNAANISLHKEWSHFAFTFKANEGISIFFNGNEVKKDVFRKNIGNATNSYGYAWFGDGTTGGFETYIDDVSLWSKKLFPNDVKFLYDKGIERNRIN